jgi:hypothetical protein
MAGEGWLGNCYGREMPRCQSGLRSSVPPTSGGLNQLNQRDACTLSYVNLRVRYCALSQWAAAIPPARAVRHLRPQAPPFRPEAITPAGSQLTVSPYAGDEPTPAKSEPTRHRLRQRPPWSPRARSASRVLWREAFIPAPLLLRENRGAGVRMMRAKQDFLSI